MHFNQLRHNNKHRKNLTGVLINNGLNKINILISIALKAKNLVNNTLMKYLQYLKAKLYHVLTHTQVLLIDLLEPSIELEELFLNTIRVNDKAIDAMQQVMESDSYLVDKVYQFQSGEISVREAATEAFTTGIIHFIADKSDSFTCDIIKFEGC